MLVLAMQSASGFTMKKQLFLILACAVYLGRGDETTRNQDDNAESNFPESFDFGESRHEFKDKRVIVKVYKMPDATLMIKKVVEDAGEPLMVRWILNEPGNVDLEEYLAKHKNQGTVSLNGGLDIDDDGQQNINGDAPGSDRINTNQNSNPRFGLNKDSGNRETAPNPQPGNGDEIEELNHKAIIGNRSRNLVSVSGGGRSGKNVDNNSDKSDSKQRGRGNNNLVINTGVGGGNGNLNRGSRRRGGGSANAVTQDYRDNINTHEPSGSGRNRNGNGRIRGEIDNVGNKDKQAFDKESSGDVDSNGISVNGSNSFGDIKDTYHQNGNKLRSDDVISKKPFRVVTDNESSGDSVESDGNVNGSPKGSKFGKLPDSDENGNNLRGDGNVNENGRNNFGHSRNVDNTLLNGNRNGNKLRSDDVISKKPFRVVTDNESSGDSVESDGNVNGSPKGSKFGKLPDSDENGNNLRGDGNVNENGRNNFGHSRNVDNTLLNGNRNGNKLRSDDVSNKPITVVDGSFRNQNNIRGGGSNFNNQPSSGGTNGFVGDADNGNADYDGTSDFQGNPLNNKGDERDKISSGQRNPISQNFVNNPNVNRERSSISSENARGNTPNEQSNPNSEHIDKNNNRNTNSVPFGDQNNNRRGGSNFNNQPSRGSKGKGFVGDAGEGNENAGIDDTSDPLNINENDNKKNYNNKGGERDKINSRPRNPTAQNFVSNNPNSNRNTNNISFGTGRRNPPSSSRNQNNNRGGGSNFNNQPSRGSGKGFVGDTGVGNADYDGTRDPLNINENDNNKNYYNKGDEKDKINNGPRSNEQNNPNSNRNTNSISFGTGRRNPPSKQVDETNGNRNRNSNKHNNRVYDNDSTNNGSPRGIVSNNGNYRGRARGRPRTSGGNLNTDEEVSCANLVGPLKALKERTNYSGSLEALLKKIIAEVS